MTNPKYENFKPLVILRKNAGYSRTEAAVILGVGINTLDR